MIDNICKRLIEQQFFLQNSCPHGTEKLTNFSIYSNMIILYMPVFYTRADQAAATTFQKAKDSPSLSDFNNFFVRVTLQLISQIESSILSVVVKMQGCVPNTIKYSLFAFNLLVFVSIFTSWYSENFFFTKSRQLTTAPDQNKLTVMTALFINHEHES